MTVTTSIEATSVEKTATRLLWLDLTRKCQLNCTHCYNASGPDGTHGTMAREDWISVLDQAAACGVRNIQFIGGCSRGCGVPRRSCRFRLGRRGPAVLPGRLALCPFQRRR